MQLGGLDIGTSGTKLTVYAEDGRFLYSAYREYDAKRTADEQVLDANDVWQATCAVMGEVAQAGYTPAAIGITSLGESFVLLDAQDRILLPSMLYTDPRGGEELSQLTAAMGEARIIAITGTKPNAMYSLPKLMWVKQHCPDVYAQTRRVLLMQDFIIYRLTGRALIDHSLAARTMALDIRRRAWSEELFAAAGIDSALFSEPVPAGHVAGCILPALAAELGLPAETRIVCGCHDQVAAALGAGVLCPGEAVDGTGTVECVTPLFDHIPEDDRLYEAGFSVVPYVLPDTFVCYAIAFSAGSMVKWYRQQIARHAAAQAAATGESVYALLDAAAPRHPTDLLVLPHFSGAGNPYMDHGSRAVIAGLTLSHTAEDIYRALLEGVTYEIRTSIELLSTLGIAPRVLYAVGGGASSPLWLSIKADVLARPVVSLCAREAGACGTAMLCAVAMGAYASLAAAKEAFVQQKDTYMPCMEHVAIYDERFAAYQKIYAAMRPIIEEVTHE